MKIKFAQLIEGDMVIVWIRPEQYPRSAYKNSTQRMLLVPIKFSGKQVPTLMYLTCQKIWALIRSLILKTAPFILILKLLHQLMVQMVIFYQPLDWKRRLKSCWSLNCFNQKRRLSKVSCGMERKATLRLYVDHKQWISAVELWLLWEISCL